MSTRKTAEVREKELRLAVYRIERGRSQTTVAKLSISAVAREVGVNPALIHNHYPVIAELIRVKQGVASRAKRDAKQVELQQQRQTSAELRREVSQLRSQVARLATLNEMLLVDNLALRAANKGTVVSIGAAKC